LELERLTDRPPVGAAELRVTVPVLVLPPSTEDGESERPMSTGAVTVNVPLAEEEAKVPVIETDVFEATGVVVAVKVAETAPDATVTEAGTAATEGVWLVRDTTEPEAGAADVSVTVPVLDVPPASEEGAKVTVETDGGRTVRVACLVTIPTAAVITHVY